MPSPATPEVLHNEVALTAFPFEVSTVHCANPCPLHSPNCLGHHGYRRLFLRLIEPRPYRQGAHWHFAFKDKPINIPLDGLPTQELIDHCPYGQAKQRLWLREPFLKASAKVYYKYLGHRCPKWAPAHTMPREVSRHLYRINHIWAVPIQTLREYVPALLSEDVIEYWDKHHKHLPFAANPWVWGLDANSIIGNTQCPRAEQLSVDHITSACAAQAS